VNTTNAPAKVPVPAWLSVGNAERVQEIRYSTDLLGDIIERRFERDPNSYVTAKRFREIERDEYELRCIVWRRRASGRALPHVNSKRTKAFWGLRERGEGEDFGDVSV